MEVPHRKKKVYMDIYSGLGRKFFKIHGPCEASFVTPSMLIQLI